MENNKNKTIIGIDRIDNNKHYTNDNCKGCCGLCNYMKKDYDLDEFIGHIHKIYENIERFKSEISIIRKGIEYFSKTKQHHYDLINKENDHETYKKKKREQKYKEKKFQQKNRDKKTKEEMDEFNRKNREAIGKSIQKDKKIVGEDFFRKFETLRKQLQRIKTNIEKEDILGDKINILINKKKEITFNKSIFDYYKKLLNKKIYDNNDNVEDDIDFKKKYLTNIDLNIISELIKKEPDLNKYIGYINKTLKIFK